ncbi:MAG: DNA-directed RNA polymerase subunit N [Candidatus Heimdallarchaeota archaeon]|nr:DNA-directed RNA polymerase subunit N [Candidatus Heimdallarchaeota archaeon]
MLTPVRCFSCGTIVGSKYEAYKEAYDKFKRGETEKTPKEVLDELGLFKYCCRRMIVSQVNLIDIILPYTR